MLNTIVHFVHMLAGIVWVGGSLILAWGFLPAVARMNAPEARGVWAVVSITAAPIAGTAGGLTILLGLVRAWTGGRVQSLQDVTSTYGLLVLAAVAIAILAEALGGALRQKFAQAMQNDVDFPDLAPPLVRRNAVTQGVLMTLIVVIMAALGLGYA